MATQTYMTAKLNLADGTIVYPQISLDNIVRSISDPTLVTVAELDANSKVSISNLPVTTSVTNSNTTVPTNGAVYGALNTKQNTLVEGDNIIHIIGGSTIMADITNLDVAGIDQTATNGVHLVLDGNTVSAAANLGTGLTVGTGSDEDSIVIDQATPAEITGAAAGKVMTPENLDTALLRSWNDAPTWKEIFASNVPTYGYIVTGSLVFILEDDGSLSMTWTSDDNSSHAMSVLDFPDGGVMGIKGVGGKFLVTCEVYNATPNSTNLVLLRYGGGGGSAVAGAGFTNETTVLNEWTTIGGLITFSAGETTYAGIRFYVYGPRNSAGSLKVRNLRLIDANNIPASLYASIISRTEYLYEDGNGIKINGKKVQIAEADPESVMIGGHTTTLTPNSLKSTFSVGQAVDCTAVPKASLTVQDADGNAANIADVYRGTFKLVNTTASTATQYLGFYDSTVYPKAANTADGTPLQYLFLMNVTNNGTATVSFGGNRSTTGTGHENVQVLSGDKWVHPGETKRMAFRFHANMVNGASATRSLFYIANMTSAAYDLTISKFRQFEVMALTDEAVNYLANVTDPDNTDDLYMIKTDMVNPWVPYIDMKTSPAITIASGLAYKVLANDNNTHVLTTDTCPAGYYGRDAHLELFVGQTGHVQVQSPLVLMQPLTPNAVNNCTIKFRDGEARLYVDDTAYGYTVTITAGTESGSLYYGLTSQTDAEYITFAEYTDDTPVYLAQPVIGSTVTKIIIGNGIEHTTIDLSEISPSYRGYIFDIVAGNGRYNFSSLTITGYTNTETTWFSGGINFWSAGNAAMDDVLVEDINIGPATALFGVGSNTGTIIRITGSTFANNHTQTSSLSVTGSTTHVLNCVFTGNKHNLVTGANAEISFQFYGNSVLDVENCTFSNSTAPSACNALRVSVNSGSPTGTCNVKDCKFMDASAAVKIESGATVSFSGTNLFNCNVGGDGYMKFAANSVIYSTDNTGVLSWPSHGSSFGKDIEIRGMTITGATNSVGLSYTSGNSKLTLVNCLITGNTAGYTSGLSVGNDYGTSTASAYISGCTIAGNTSVHGEGCLGIGSAVRVDIIDTVTDGHCSFNCTNTHLLNCTIWSFHTYDKTVIYISGMLDTTGIKYGGSSVNPGKKYFIQGATVHFWASSSDSSTVDAAGGMYIGSFLDDDETIFVLGGTITAMKGDNVVASGISGIGTYIRADGTNDFSDPYVITADSGTGENTLYYGITTSTDKYLLMDYDTENATAVIDSDVNSRDMAITTASGDTIVGGTSVSITEGSTVSTYINKDESGVIDIAGSTVFVTGGSINFSGKMNIAGTIKGAVTFSQNTLTSIIGVPGAVIDYNGLTAGRIATTSKITDVTFKNGQRDANHGGGLRLDVPTTGTTVTIEGCTFSNNKAPTYGGALSVVGNGGSTGTCVLNNCYFDDNNVATHADIYVDSGGNVKISGCTFTRISGNQVAIYSNNAGSYRPAITLSGTNIYKATMQAYGSQAQIILADNAVIDTRGTAGALTATLIAGAVSDSIVVGTNVKIINSDNPSGVLVNGGIACTCKTLYKNGTFATS